MRNLTVWILAISSLTYCFGGTGETISKLRVADLKLDLDKKLAYRGSRTIELTAKEFGWHRSGLPCSPVC